MKHNIIHVQDLCILILTTHFNSTFIPCWSTGSRSITKVKQHWARLVLGWVTAWEHRVKLGPFLFIFNFNTIFLILICWIKFKWKIKTKNNKMKINFVVWMKTQKNMNCVEKEIQFYLLNGKEWFRHIGYENFYWKYRKTGKHNKIFYKFKKRFERIGLKFKKKCIYIYIYICCVLCRTKDK